MKLNSGSLSDWLVLTSNRHPKSDGHRGSEQLQSPILQQYLSRPTFERRGIPRDWCCGFVVFVLIWHSGVSIKLKRLLRFRRQAPFVSRSSVWAAWLKPPELLK